MRLQYRAVKKLRQTESAWNQELIIKDYKNENCHLLLMNEIILFCSDIFQINWIQNTQKWLPDLLVNEAGFPSYVIPWLNTDLVWISFLTAVLQYVQSLLFILIFPKESGNKTKTRFFHKFHIIFWIFQRLKSKLHIFYQFMLILMGK